MSVDEKFEKLFSEHVKFFKNLRKHHNSIYESLFHYTGDGYSSINRYLRDNEYPKDKLLDHHVNNIRRAFELVPILQESITVYRGIRKNVEHDIEIDMATSKFLSASYLESEARVFSGSECCMMKITVPAGARVLPLFIISNSPDEKEILLPDKGRITIINIDKSRTPNEYYISFTPRVIFEIETNDIYKPEYSYDKEFLELISNKEELSMYTDLDNFDITDIFSIFPHYENVSKEALEQAEQIISSYNE